MACWLLIAGSADSMEFATCERIGLLMETSLPSAKCEAIPVLLKEWQAYLQDICVKLNIDYSQ